MAGLTLAKGAWSGITMAVAGDGTPLPTAAASKLGTGAFVWHRLVRLVEAADLLVRFGDR